MKVNALTLCSAGWLMLTTQPVNAEFIQIGGLVHDTETKTILDASRDRMYSALDAFNLSVQDTYAMLSDPDSQFFGWQIMDTVVNSQFMDALFDGNAEADCSNAVTRGDRAVSCGNLLAYADWQDGLLGENWTNDDNWTLGDGNKVIPLDRWGFVSTDPIISNDLARPFGTSIVWADGRVKYYDSFYTESGFDRFGQTNQDLHLNLMLYYDIPAPITTPVSAPSMLPPAGPVTSPVTMPTDPAAPAPIPEPATLWLMLTGAWLWRNRTAR